MISAIKKHIKKLNHFLTNGTITPKTAAFSIALGIFIGIIIPMGLQTIIIIPISICFRANVYLSTTATLITNPITIIPIYYLALEVGSQITNYNINWELVKHNFESLNINQILLLSSDLLSSLIIGIIIVALILSFVVYFVIFFIIKIFKRQIAEI